MGRRISKNGDKVYLVQCSYCKRIQQTLYTVKTRCPYCNREFEGGNYILKVVKK